VDAVRAFRAHLPDVTLMDLRLPDMSGIDAMIAIREASRNARIIVLTTFDGDLDVQRALAAGARGYLLKSTPPDELTDAIRVPAGRLRHYDHIGGIVDDGGDSFAQQRMVVHAEHTDPPVTHPGIVPRPFKTSLSVRSSCA
jgi:DNA-binding NarL/FixJ family response regulator